MCFREEEVDEDNLEPDPAGVYDEVFPSDCSKRDGIDKRGEEIGSSPKELEEGDSPRPLCVWEQLDEIGCNLLGLPPAFDFT